MCKRKKKKRRQTYISNWLEIRKITNNDITSSLVSVKYTLYQFKLTGKLNNKGRAGKPPKLNPFIKY